MSNVPEDAPELVTFGGGENLLEVDERNDAANRVSLFLDPGDGKLIIEVEPKDIDQTPFRLRVRQEAAADVFAHPYPYKDLALR